MEKEQLISYLKDPATLDRNTLSQLDELRKDFPFSQTIQLLYILNLYTENDPAFDKKLRSVAASVADRAKLRSWIVYLDSRREAEAGRPKERKEAVAPSKNNKELEELEARIMEEMNELEERRAKIRELMRKKEQMMTSTDEDSADQAPQEKPVALPKDKLLEDFIRNQEKKRPTFFNPVEWARKSITDQPDVVSETLAQLNARQGNIKKAIEIYKVLSLKFPEKSSYFAAQIERLKKK